MRLLAVGFLGEAGPDAKEAIPALALLLTKERAELREVIVRALGAIGPEARDALEKATADEDAKVSREARKQLERLRTKKG